MKRGLQGEYLVIPMGDEDVRAFLPYALPPSIDWNAGLRTKYEQALVALGRLNGVADWIPNPTLLLYMYVRKEAVLSSMIEGTQSSLSDLLLHELAETPGVPLDDVREVSQYVAALTYGISRLEEGMPISLRLIREIHGVLLARGRGSVQTPGLFRRSQNWIGGTRPGNAAFVPPPVEAMTQCLYDLEAFLHDETHSALVKAALAHVQFETIHPFLDGNGRLGRLLITLLLCDQQVLVQPLLYVSLYFKTHRRRYYELLTNVREEGDWEAWLDFFADAVISTAHQAVETARQLHELMVKDQVAMGHLGRASASALRVYQAFLERPIATSAALVECTGLTAATVNKAVGHLQALGIVEEITSQQRNRVFMYVCYMRIMDRGTELPT